MKDSTIEVMIFGVMHCRGHAGGSEYWADVALPDAGTDEYVSITLPKTDHRLVRVLRLARRRQTKLLVPADFFDRAGDEQLTALREGLRATLWGPVPGEFH